jgi:acyl carrier protein
MLDKQVIRDFLTTLAKKDSRIGDDDSLLATKMLDSLAVAELVVFLEDRYKVNFDNDDLTPENLDSINAIASFLERKGIS